MLVVVEMAQWVVLQPDFKIAHQKHAQLLGAISEMLETWGKVEEMNSPPPYIYEVLISWKASVHPKIKINTNGAVAETLDQQE